LRELWSLRPDVTYLNHGSFGACPRPILDLQARLREEMEREPVDFLWRSLPERLHAVRRDVAAFIGADADGVAFVANATEGVNAVLRSLAFRAGDEILVTDHGYAACNKAAAFAASRSGAVVVRAPVPFPVASENEIFEAIVSRAGPRTRLAVVDHVTSPTALIFPLERIVLELERRGVAVLVDGAHALGMVPQRLGDLGASYYTANAHKWLCAPKGAAILHVREDRRGEIHPLAISHGYDPATGDSRFREEFDWTGTFDPTAWLTLSECIRFLGSLLPGGWPALMERNRALALRGRDVVASSLGVAPPCPDGMIGSMASLPLPEAAPGSPAAALDHEGLTVHLRERGIESWFHPWDCAGGRVVRLSAQAYNEESDYVTLAASLREAGYGRA
jgi:isopenicillin-N epimerase